MLSITTTAILFFDILTLVSSDAGCNCYCPTKSDYVGYYPLATPSTPCDAQACLIGCPDAFFQCGVGTTYASCRDDANFIQSSVGTTYASSQDNANFTQSSVGTTYTSSRDNANFTQSSAGTTYASSRDNANFSQSSVRTTYASCRDNANGLTLSVTSLIFGLIAVFLKKYL